MGPLAVSQLAVWGFSIGLGPSPRLGQFSALGASLGARISASKDGGRRLLRLEARLGGALTIPGLRQQQLWNVCSPSLLSVRALRRRGVSSQMARQGQSAVQSKDGGGCFGLQSWLVFPQVRSCVCSSGEEALWGLVPGMGGSEAPGGQ